MVANYVICFLKIYKNLNYCTRNIGDPMSNLIICHRQKIVIKCFFRSHVLHKLLDGVVQRRDYSVLAPYLPPKHEYVLFVRLSDVQVKLCQHYMDNYAQRRNSSSKVSFIFADFQQLQMICTHPRVLMNRSLERKEKFDDEDSEGSLKDFVVNDEEGSSSSSSSASSSGSDSDTDGSHSSKKKKKQQKTRITRAQAAHSK